MSWRQASKHRHSLAGSVAFRVQQDGPLFNSFGLFLTVFNHDVKQVYKCVLVYNFWFNQVWFFFLNICLDCFSVNRCWVSLGNAFIDIQGTAGEDLSEAGTPA